MVACEQNVQVYLSPSYSGSITSSVALGCWLFAFFVGVVSACAIVGELAAAQHATTGAIQHHDVDGDAQTGCEQFCANDIHSRENPPPDLALYARFLRFSL